MAALRWSRTCCRPHRSPHRPQPSARSPGVGVAACTTDTRAAPVPYPTQSERATPLGSEVHLRPARPVDPRASPVAESTGRRPPPPRASCRQLHTGAPPLRPVWHHGHTRTVDARGKMLAVRAVLAACVLAVVAAGCSSSATPTELRVFNPWDVSGLRDGLDVIAEGTGECFTPAASVDRPDGWRCAAGSSLHDPCFIGGEPVRAACLDAPWSTSVTLLELPDAPARPAATSDNGALWAMQLVGGERCLAIDGATATAAGQRLNFTCDGGDIYGTADRTRDRWTVTYQADGEAEQRPREVEVAWH